MVIDVIVETKNSEMLDATVQGLGAYAVVANSFDGTKCKVRCFGDPEYLKFAIGSQGYGNVLGEEAIG